MSDKTGIEWTRSDDGTPGATWNPVTGCTKVSPGCDHCYAETFAERWRGIPGHYFERGFEVQLRPEKLAQPLRWTRPRRIFVNSMADLFHQDVPDEYIARVFAVMAMASQHTFLILTKRHARMRSFLQDDCRCGTGHVPGVHLRSAMDWAGTKHSPTYVPGVVGREVYHNRPWPLPNVWVGVSAEDQHWADIRIPALLQTPAAVRFVSAEPLLGPIDLIGHPDHGCEGIGPAIAHHGVSVQTDYGTGVEYDCEHQAAIDWVIVGGESGAGARPMQAEWAQAIVRGCQSAQVPVFVKQLGSSLGKQLGAGPKGGDMTAWPEDLRVRQFPTVSYDRPAILDLEPAS